MKLKRRSRTVLLSMAAVLLTSIVSGIASSAINIAQEPLYLGTSAAPLNMLVLGRDHKLYYEAYNDASDLDGDGVLNVGYEPDALDYLGYFDSYKCYAYDEGAERFQPTGATLTKRCDNAWSGDFLNYLTTARIDALRKVLYGGSRIIDTDDLVVLGRSYIPQDAHSWGKEYRGLVQDGYDISDYTPLPLPASGTRHLFANTTLLKSGNKEPLLRVLVHSEYRIWEWVAIERPVAGNRCEHGSSGPLCEPTGSDAECQIVPDLDLTHRTYRITNRGPASGPQSAGKEHPNNENQFDRLEDYNAIDDNFCGEQQVSEIDGEGNPFAGTASCTNESYLSIFTGTISIEDAGSYTFALDGDDAIDLAIDGDVIAGWYKGHSACSNERCRCDDHTGSVYLLPGTHTLRFRHEENWGDDSYYLRWHRSTPPSTMTDYVVRVEVCDPAVGLEANCRVYPSGDYKPSGLLQKHGEDDQMLFGLISGSYTHPHNMQGGVVRKNMGSITDEIDLHTGQLTSQIGIIRTIDQLRIVDFNMDKNYEYNGGWLTTAPMPTSSKEFPDWGNPIGEMLYECVRYYAGKTEPTPLFLPSLTDGFEEIPLRDYSGSNNQLRLPVVTWKDPFDEDDLSTSWCSAGAMLVISDLYPSYDTDTVPGTRFGSFAGDIAGLDAAAEADEIWQAEHGVGSRQHFIGQVGTDYDGAPTEKTVSGLGGIRGLAPEEPTKQGGYYAAGVAKFAFENDLRDDLQGKQNLNTFVVALASPLPRIALPVGGSVVTVVPFAKSVGGSSINRSQGEFQPTNTIVDFFVDTFANTDPLGSDADANVNDGRPFVRFRINFEDVEQGADHDMDAIVVYELRANADDTLTVSLVSEYAAGSIQHHLGYVISGTTQDGVYLEVRDQDTTENDDPDYFLDTPHEMAPGDCEFGWPSICTDALPLTGSRTFTPATATVGATLLQSPLWYAAKYATPESGDLAEGEASSNYFLVTNAANLERQLDNAFEEILGLVSSASTAATNSTQFNDGTLIYQARFDSDDWSGEVRAMEVNDDGNLRGLRWSTDLAGSMPDPDDRHIYTQNGVTGIEFRAEQWDDLALTQCAGLLDVDAEALRIALVSATGDTDAGCGDLDEAEDLDIEIDLDLGLARLAWLRGDQTREASGEFRARDKLLGDIVNSNPFLVGQNDYGFDQLPRGSPETDYQAFRDQLQEAARSPVLYVGANDGMLHGFDGDTGEEVLAFMPMAAFEHIAELTRPDYVHRYFVDGSPRALDAFIEVEPNTPTYAWRTVLVSSTGAGGRSVFALDVTEPNAFAADHVLWEFTHAELGTSIGQATITRLAAGHRWVALFGNGYNGQSATAQLFVVDLATGTLLKRIDTGIGDGENPNGLSSPTPVDLDDDRVTDIVYAGDLQGNLWKFDFTGEDINDWQVSLSGSPLFTAADANLAAQPITVRPAVARHPYGGQMVLFGTGKFFSDEDNVVAADEQVQSFYGIRDAGVAIGTGQDTLQEQTILYQGSAGDPDIRADVRIVSRNSIDWNTQSGWYINLSYQGVREGERVVDYAVMRTDRIVFTTMIPNDNECASGGNSWLMEVEFVTGARLLYSAFDLNEDQAFGLADFIAIKLPSEAEAGATVEVRLPSSGILIPAIAKVPAFVSLDGKDVKYSSLSSGELMEIDNKADRSTGRQSWRQLR